MVKQIKISPVTRIEGHAQVTIDLDDSNKVTDARLNIMEVRGFEKFLQGRPAEEAPRIVTQICGICPVSHHLASAKAVDELLRREDRPDRIQAPRAHADRAVHTLPLAALLLPGGPGLRVHPGRRRHAEERLRRHRRQPGAGHRGRALPGRSGSRSSRPPQAAPSTRSPPCPAASPRD